MILGGNVYVRVHISLLWVECIVVVGCFNCHSWSVCLVKIIGLDIPKKSFIVFMCDIFLYLHVIHVSIAFSVRQTRNVTPFRSN